DALCAGAEIILAVENAAKTSGSLDTVGTTGVCRVEPGAVNSIPSRVSLEIDVRDIELACRDAVVEKIRREVERTAQNRGLHSTIELLNADPPARVAEEIVHMIQAVCRRLDLAHRPMVSRAYHDSLFMTRICPTGMIFVPCKDGISHRPDEY